MKKFILFFVLGFLALSFNCYSQIKVNSNGYVGINNTSPSYRIDLSGNLHISDNIYELTYSSGILSPANESYGTLCTNGNWWTFLYAGSAYFYYYEVITSDERFKTDITNLPSSKEKIIALRPVKYKKAVPKNCAGKISPDKEEMGFLAQEMKKIFPDIVVENEKGELGIQYTALIPVLVKAFQEQQTEIDSLKARIEKLETDKK
jgi:hypothetical protein